MFVYKLLCYICFNNKLNINLIILDRSALGGRFSKLWINSHVQLHQNIIVLISDKAITRSNVCAYILLLYNRVTITTSFADNPWIYWINTAGNNPWRYVNRISICIELKLQIPQSCLSLFFFFFNSIVYTKISEF